MGEVTHMGHRAYIAYERDDDRFNVHYSHWGAHNLSLCSEITEQTPFGGDTDESDTPIKPDPDEIGLTIAEVCDLADDVMIEALYIVTREFDVYPFEPLRVRFDTDNHTGNVLYYGWDSDRSAADSYRKGWAAGIRQTLETFVEEGQLTEAEARNRYITHILEQAADSPSERVLSYSTALTDTHLEQYPTAYVFMTGQTNVLGQMHPTGYRDVHDWALDTESVSLPDPV